MSPDEKLTTGLNDRPKDASIAQTGAGLPDDSGRALEASDESVDQMKQTLYDKPRQKLMEEVEEQIQASEKGSE